MTTPEQINDACGVFREAMQNWGVEVTCRVLDLTTGLFAIDFALWGREYRDCRFRLEDNGLRTDTKVPFWLNCSVHVWQWIAMRFDQMVVEAETK